MKSTNQKVIPLAVLRAEKMVLDALRYGRTDIKSSEVHDLAGDMLSREIPRRATLRNVLWLIYDMQKGGADESFAQAFPEGVAKWIRSLWAENEGKLDFTKEWIHEEETEGLCDVEEVRFSVERSHTALFRLENAHRRHVAASERRLRAARQELGPVA